MKKLILLEKERQELKNIVKANINAMQIFQGTKGYDKDRELLLMNILDKLL